MLPTKFEFRCNNRGWSPLKQHRRFNRSGTRSYFSREYGLRLRIYDYFITLTSVGLYVRSVDERYYINILYDLVIYLQRQCQNIWSMMKRYFPTLIYLILTIDYNVWQNCLSKTDLWPFIYASSQCIYIYVCWNLMHSRWIRHINILIMTRCVWFGHCNGQIYI